MSLPATLYGNYISIIGGKTTQNLTSITKGLQFGLVQGGNENLGNEVSVLFRINNDTIHINDGTNDYFLISENDIVLIEDAALS